MTKKTQKTPLNITMKRLFFILLSGGLIFISGCSNQLREDNSGSLATDTREEAVTTEGGIEDWRAPIEMTVLLGNVCETIKQTGERKAEGVIDEFEALSPFLRSLTLVEVINQAYREWTPLSHQVTYKETLGEHIENIKFMMNLWEDDEIDSYQALTELPALCSSIMTTYDDLLADAYKHGVRLEDMAALVEEISQGTEDSIGTSNDDSSDLSVGGNSTDSQPEITQPSSVPTPTEFETPPVTGGWQPEGPDLEVIHINHPGPLSEVTSPVEVAGISGPTQHQYIVVQISDQNGVVINRQGTYIEAGLGASGPFEISLDFSVGQDQPGLISVYYVSARDGGVVHLSSVSVTLLASGFSNFTSGGDPNESIFIRTPQADAEISGGTLEVEGLFETAIGGNLGIVLCGESGYGALELFCGTDDNVLAEGIAKIGPQESETFSWFNGVLSYTVSTQTAARIAVFAVDPLTGLYHHISTQYITLYP